jgi:ElaB/YqjD/DUF883 family membrane-anchored ribosome-binding protein
VITPFSVLLLRVKDFSMQTKTKTGNGQAMNLEQFLEDIKVVVKDGEELLRSGASTVKDRAMTGAKATDKKIRQYPYHSLGIVFGAGLVAGVLAACMMRGGSEEN